MKTETNWSKYCKKNPTVRAWSNHPFEDVKPPKRPTKDFKEQLIYLLSMDSERDVFAKAIAELITEEVIKMCKDCIEEMIK